MCFIACFVIQFHFHISQDDWHLADENTRAPLLLPVHRKMANHQNDIFMHTVTQTHTHTHRNIHALFTFTIEMAQIPPDVRSTISELTHLPPVTPFSFPAICFEKCVVHSHNI